MVPQKNIKKKVGKKFPFLTFGAMPEETTP
jgi:hypothetical protein